MFNHASCYLRLVVSFGLIGLLLMVFLPIKATGFVIRDTTTLNSSPNIVDQDVGTSSPVHCANDPESLKEQRRGISLRECQTKQIREKEKIARIDSNETVPLIEITEEQKSEIISIYGSYFRDKSSLEKTEEGMNRVTRDVHSVEVCPSIPSWDDLQIVKGADGKFRQLVQFPTDDLKQYILQEKCQRSISDVLNNVSCKLKQRLVRALIIDPIANLIMEYDVVVDCCAAYTNI